MKNSKIAGKNYFYLIAVISVFIIFSTIILALFTIRDTDRSLSYLDRSYEVNERIDRLSHILIDAGIGQRVYFITRNKIYLRKYTDARQHIAREYDSLSRILSNKTDQEGILTTLKEKIGQKLMQLDSVKSYFEKSGKIDDTLVSMVMRSRALSDTIQQAIANIKTRENMDLYIVREKTFSKSRSSLTIITVTSCISIFVLIGTLLLLRREYNSKLIIENDLIVSEKLLQQQIEKLNASNKELEHFAYVASHDLEEPLRKITTFSERVQEKLKNQKDPEITDYLTRLSTSAGRMRVLIRELLNYSRSTRLLDIDESVSLDAELKLVIDDLSESFRTRKADIVVETLPDVHGNRTQLRQLLQNLLSNALKFNTSEIPKISVSAQILSNEEIKNKAWGKDSTYEQKKYCCIFVADNGIGFSKEYLHQIFVIFQRLHGRSEYEGTGIGLAVCKRIAENHGGFITAESTPGKGSVFIVGLPVV